MENDLIRRSALLESIEGIDWYSVNGHMVMTEGAPNEESAYVRYTDVAQSVEAAGAVDAVEVVRCKDCKHWQVCVDGVTTWCPMLMDKNTQADDFCSYGERRNNENP